MIMVIKKLKLTNDYNPYVWEQNDLDKIKEGLVFVGYCFKTLKNEYFLTLYLSNNKQYEIPLTSIINLWRDKPDIAYKNPPLDEWLDTKKNWCNMITKKMSVNYNLEFDEVLSELYYIICKINNKDKYIGNLNYIIKSLTRDLARLKKKQLQECENVSLEAEAFDDGNNEELLFIDIIKDEIYTEQNYEDLLKDLRSSMRAYLSDREIDLLLSTFDKRTYTSMLPNSIYYRFRKWREKHKAKEFMKDESDR